ncbi:Leucine rich repeat-containing protein [Lachnospiraceae bacterium KH1T2]|nr:Leucine rich repeat-containing protein [Lachnospiraceae bacterium KH1T2]
MAKKSVKRKRYLRMKKGVRRTIATLLMVTALIVAAIPAPSLRAADTQSENEREDTSSTEATDGVEPESVTSTFPAYDSEGNLWIQSPQDLGVALGFVVDKSKNTAMLAGYDTSGAKDADDVIIYSDRSKIENVTLPVTATDPDGVIFTVTGVNKCSGDLHTFRIASESGVTRTVDIGGSAFANDKYLTGIPEGADQITSIGSYAFQNTEKFVDIWTIPASVVSIGSHAFEGSGITGVTFASGSALKTLDAAAFAGADKLGSADLSACTALTTLKGETFKDCTALTTVNIDNGALTVLGSSEFAECVMLKTIKFPSTLTGLGVGNKCFENSAIQELDLGDTSITAFYGDTVDGCTSLAKVSLPSTVQNIGNGAFKDCAALTEFVLKAYECGIEGWDSGGFIQTGLKDDCVIVGYAHKYESDEGKELDDLTGSQGKAELSDIFKFALQNGFKFKDLDGKGESSEDWFDGTYKIDNDGKLVYINKGSTVWTDDIADGVITIPKAVYGKDVKGIAGYQAVLKGFSEAASTIELPATLLSIDDQAFYNCPNIKEVKLDAATSDDVTIGSEAFEGTADGFILYGPISASNGAFNYAMNTKITPTGGTQSDYIKYANADGDETAVDNPLLIVQKQQHLSVRPVRGAEDTNYYNTLIEVRPGADTITKVTIPSGIEYLNKQFTAADSSSGTALESLTAGGLKVIDDFELSNNKNLKEASITMADGGVIGYAPFKEDKKLASPTVTGAGYSSDAGVIYTDSGATILELVPGVDSDVYRPQNTNVTAMLKYAFSGEYAKDMNINLLGTGITVIPEYAFYQNDTLNKLELGDKVKRVEEHAFAQDESNKYSGESVFIFRNKDTYIMNINAFENIDKNAKIKMSSFPTGQVYEFWQLYGDGGNNIIWEDLGSNSLSSDNCYIQPDPLDDEKYDSGHEIRKNSKRSDGSETGKLKVYFAGVQEPLTEYDDVTQVGDYYLKYENNTDVGTAYIHIIGRNNYTGMKTVSFNIVDKDDSDEETKTSLYTNPFPLVVSLNSTMTVARVTKTADSSAVHPKNNGYFTLNKYTDGSVIPTDAYKISGYFADAEGENNVVISTPGSYYVKLTSVDSDYFTGYHMAPLTVKDSASDNNAGDDDPGKNPSDGGGGNTPSENDAENDKYKSSLSEDCMPSVTPISATLAPDGSTIALTPGKEFNLLLVSNNSIIPASQYMIEGYYSDAECTTKAVPSQAGSYYIKVVPRGSSSTLKGYIIIPLEVSTNDSLIISSIQNQYWTGSTVTPALSVHPSTDISKTLTANQDYSAAYSSNIGPGAATASVKGKSIYDGKTATATFSILKSIENCTVHADNTAYTGERTTPTVVVTDGSKQLTQGTDFVVSNIENNVKINKKGKVTVEGIGYYYGSKTAKFSVLKVYTSSSSSSSKSSSSSSSSRSTSSSSSSTASSSSSSAAAATSDATTTSTNTVPGTENVSPANGNGYVSTGTQVPVDSGDTDFENSTATVNGSTDNNYVVKITKSSAADAEFRSALESQYGNIDAFKYYAMDISLYDETGTTKIENPQGVSVTLTVPLPDETVSYGGNNQAAAVGSIGNLEDLSTRFTTIGGKACATFTATHFSTYGFYVDTNNLSANGSLDSTPKTGDPISPKWFLSLGLAALSMFLFLKRDPIPVPAVERVRPAR